MDYNIYKSYDANDEIDYIDDGKPAVEDEVSKSKNINVQSFDLFGIIILLLLIIFVKRLFWGW
ncbi:MAG: hypothetical protein QME46_09515 [Thermoanaerobacteraceae bacterium]|nr:hypothetical protein [Thermoanaerobacteraceae bacterium]